MLRSTATKFPLASSIARYDVARTASMRTFITTAPALTSQANQDEAHEEKAVEQKAQDTAAKQKDTKTQAQLDKELQEKMMGISGDGGSAGIEYENGEPVAMKRSVKNNMFRYI